MIRDWTAEDAEMAIRKEDWPTINETVDKAVARAIEPLTPRGWRKARHELREIAPLGGIFSVVLALIAMVVALGIAVVNRTTVEATFRGKTDQRLEGIERQLTDLRALVASSQPGKIQNQDAAKTLLAEARQKLVPPLPVPIVEQSGNSFIEASRSDPKAWPVALDFLSYRSSINENFLPHLSEPPRQPKFAVQAIIRGPKGSTGPIPSILLVGTTTTDKAARFELLVPVPNVPVTHWEEDEAQYLIIDFHGLDLSLDGMHLKNVIVKNANVIYTGQAITLQNVTFVNCTFMVTEGDKAEQLARNILGSSAVDYRAS